MLDEEPHQPLGVEDELIPAGLLVPVEDGAVSPYVRTTVVIDMRCHRPVFVFFNVYRISF